MALASRLRRDAGQALVEYSLVLALVAVAATYGARAVGLRVDRVFDDAAEALVQVAEGGNGHGAGGNGHGAGGNGQGNNGNGNGNGGPTGSGPGGGSPGS